MKKHKSFRSLRLSSEPRLSGSSKLGVSSINACQDPLRHLLMRMAFAMSPAGLVPRPRCATCPGRGSSSQCSLRGRPRPHRLRSTKGQGPHFSAPTEPAFPVAWITWKPRAQSIATIVRNHLGTHCTFKNRAIAAIHGYVKGAAQFSNSISQLSTNSRVPGPNKARGASTKS